MARQHTDAVGRPTADRRLAMWLALLVLASVVFSLGFACAVPLAAFGATAALTLRRRTALLLAAAVWFANQIVGYSLLHYPVTANSLTWGAILGVVAVLSTLAAQELVWRLDRAGAPASLVLPASFLCAFAVYEGGLFVVSAGIMGGAENYTPAIIGRILAINVAAFAGLAALNALGRAGGVRLRRLGQSHAMQPV